ncbi:MAG: hypothetical protein Hyperionvirus4_31 [Hyperionvirus sp.]|uniref:Uncharacterized protein n=1 Tax=Hyperionvirus sp. TaxID=2487770 RepID=A0A3G5A742_9VIRU|nr:MAG: hypothetical protein Hyperionvirus4_31 [Hyperionvirus sp.]
MSLTTIETITIDEKGWAGPQIEIRPGIFCAIHPTIAVETEVEIAILPDGTSSACRTVQAEDSKRSSEAVMSFYDFDLPRAISARYQADVSNPRLLKVHQAVTVCHRKFVDSDGELKLESVSPGSQITIIAFDNALEAVKRGVATHMLQARIYHVKVSSITKLGSKTVAQHFSDKLKFVP